MIPEAIEPDHLCMVNDVLRRHLPPEAEVWVYGSRATGRRVRRGSDLDLMIRADGPMDFGVLDTVREALSESLLPYMVDLHDWHRTDAAFLGRIAHEMVPLPSPVPVAVQPGP